MCSPMNFRRALNKKSIACFTLYKIFTVYICSCNSPKKRRYSWNLQIIHGSLRLICFNRVYPEIISADQASGATLKRWLFYLTDLYWGGLLSDTKLTEYIIQLIFICDLPCNFTKIMQAGFNIKRKQVAG